MLLVDAVSGYCQPPVDVGIRTGEPELGAVTLIDWANAPTANTRNDKNRFMEVVYKAQRYGYFRLLQAPAVRAKTNRNPF